MINDYRELLIKALAEDVGSGDHTSLACVDNNVIGRAKLLIKEKGILAGVEVAKEIFNIVDKDIKYEQLLSDGDDIDKNNIVFIVEGRAQSILKCERLVLNFLQRMSGIATETRSYVKLLDGLKTKILDTRKTTPNMRFFEKWAVRIGGGQNHRMGLYDMILIKDNHIDYAGGIENAIIRTRKYLKDNNLDLKVEIEARNIEEVKEIISVGGVDIIMLDNFSVPKIKEALSLINGMYKTEASGGINKNTIREIAETGVDYISLGVITHHIKSLDMSLKAF